MIKPTRRALAVCLLISVLLANCGGSSTGPTAQETQIAAAVAAILAANTPSAPAPVITVVVTAVSPAASDLSVSMKPTPTPAAPPPAGQEEIEISLQPGGGGDYATLADAIRNATAGAHIVLAPGTYPLAEAVTIDRPLTLEGAGAEQTIITSTAAEHVLKFEGPGLFSATGITFLHEGMEAANVVVVLGGEIDFSFCTFQGGVCTSATGYGGNGLLVAGSTTGYIDGCNAGGNLEQGILVRDQARPSITNSLIQNNGGCGIAYYDGAAGYAEANVISHNLLHGICVTEAAAPVLEQNACRLNTNSGIVYFNQASGEAHGNDCSLNAKDGIAVQGQAQPLLESNSCFGNGQNDIAYYETAGGIARSNRCSTDAPDGLNVLDSANPSLSDNVCPLSGAAVQTGESKTPQPQYNPDSGEGLGPTCFNSPAPAIDREWQTSAGDGSFMRGESVPLSLRNKWGESAEAYGVTVRVIAPDGTETLAFGTLDADTAAELTYPDDFVGGSTDLRGPYTLIWEIDFEFIACNGFVITGGAD